jgi:hypothetical protein
MVEALRRRLSRDFLLTELSMRMMKLCSLIIALGALLVVTPSVAYPSMNGLPHLPQIGSLILPGGNQLTDPANPIHLASLVGRQAAGSVKRPARSTLATLFANLFRQRDNVYRPRASANIFVRKPKRESQGPKLEETPGAQPTVAPDEKAASFITPAAMPAAASSQSPPITPVLTPGPGASRINDLPALPLE